MLVFADLSGDVIEQILRWLCGRRTRNNFLVVCVQIFKKEILNDISEYSMAIAEYGLRYVERAFRTNINMFSMFIHTRDAKNKHHMRFFIELGIPQEQIYSSVCFSALLIRESISALEYLKKNNPQLFKSTIGILLKYTDTFKILFIRNSVASLEFIFEETDLSDTNVKNAADYSGDCQNVKILEKVFKFIDRSYAIRRCFNQFIKAKNLIGLKFLVKKYDIIADDVNYEIEYVHVFAASLGIIEYLFNDLGVLADIPDNHRVVVNSSYSLGYSDAFYFLTDKFKIKLGDCKLQDLSRQAQTFLTNCDAKLLEHVIKNGDINKMTNTLLHGYTAVNSMHHFARTMTIEKFQLLAKLKHLCITDALQDDNLACKLGVSGNLPILELMINLTPERKERFVVAFTRGLVEEYVDCDLVRQLVNENSIDIPRIYDYSSSLAWMRNLDDKMVDILVEHNLLHKLDLSQAYSTGHTHLVLQILKTRKFADVREIKPTHPNANNDLFCCIVYELHL